MAQYLNIETIGSIGSIILGPFGFGDSQNPFFWLLLYGFPSS